MGKAEAGTPKAISKAIKAKGLQKLMFYCQVCEKQCRDANGFKCHIASESHQRQMLIVAENPNRFLEDYSRQFLKDFMHLFKTRFGSKRVFANQVYQEYIKDRNHVHMNSTKWYTLGAFVHWMGRNSYAIVDQTERGLYITYIDRDPETLMREENARQKEKMEKDYDERMRIIMNKQIERGKQLSRPTIEEKNENKILKRESENDKIVLNLQFNKKTDEKQEKDDKIDVVKDNLKCKTEKKSFDEEPESLKSNEDFLPKISNKRQKEIKRSALDDIIEEEENKRKILKKDNWIEKDLIVKVISKKVPEKYQMNKGVIEKVEHKYLAYVRMIKSKALIKLDQDDLETVIPKEGSLVKIVNGGYQGQIAKLIKIDTDKITAKIQIDKGSHIGRQIDVDFDNICKFVQ